jgi:uncharacterized protein (TIGR02145 family)
VKTSASLLALLYIAAFAQQKGTFTDTRGSKTYKTTKIGEQVWMAENLNYEVEGSRCYKDSISYCDKYGRLYDWATAMKVCPKGWHLPSNEEWDKLIRYADGDKSTKNPYRSKTTAGKYLKATSGWNDSGNGEDKFGFSALPGGDGNSGGDFNGVGYYGGWWSTSDYLAYYRYMSYSNNSVYHRNKSTFYGSGGKSYLQSVRCVGD